MMVALLSPRDFTNVPIDLSNKKLLIDIEVVNAQLDCNLLLGHSYMYAMCIVSSIVFRLLMFPHGGKIMTIDQLMYYDLKGPATLEHVLPTIKTTIDRVSIPSLPFVGSGLFSSAPMTNTFFSLPPPPSLTNI